MELRAQRNDMFQSPDKIASFSMTRSNSISQANIKQQVVRAEQANSRQSGHKSQPSIQAHSSKVHPG
jgi:hypothetical protein